MKFYLFEKDSSNFFFETYCLESVTKRVRSYDHDLNIVTSSDSIPEKMKKIFSEYFNFEYINNPRCFPGTDSVLFSFKPSCSIYLPSLVLRLIRDRTLYKLTDEVIEGGMKSVIDTLANKADFKRYYVILNSRFSTKQYLIPHEILMAAFLREIDKYDEDLKIFPLYTGILGALGGLLTYNISFKESVKNILLEYYTGRKIELTTYDDSVTFIVNKNPYGTLSVDVDYLMPFIYYTEE